MSKKISAFVGFLGHYAAEVSAVAEALSGVVNALPIDAQDRARIGDIIETLSDVPANIAATLEKVTGEFSAPEVRVNKKDVEAAVKAVLAPAIAEALAVELPGALSAILPEQVDAILNEKLGA